MLLKMKVWIKDQAVPVLCTFDSEDEPLRPVTSSPDFLRFRNIRGGDWILPKKDVLKIQVSDLKARDVRELEINHELPEREA